MRNPCYTDFFAHPQISLSAIESVGASLNRPECVASGKSGRLYTSNWRGGVSVRSPEGHWFDVVAQTRGIDLKPNGIAPLPNGAFLIANLSEAGGIWHLDRRANLSPTLIEIDGEPVAPANFVLADTPNSSWVTISTQKRPRTLAYRRDIQDGTIIRITDGSAAIVADGLGYSNECQVSPCGSWLYVNETFARRLSRFPIIKSDRLGKRETVQEFGEGVFPDGLCFDVEGGIWITSIVSNSVLRLDPNGELTVIIADCDIDHVDWVEAAYQSNSMARMHLDRAGGHMLRNISSLAFAGPDMKTAYLGCLLDNKIYRFQSPISGVRPQHWSWS